MPNSLQELAKPSRPGRLLRREGFTAAKNEGKRWVSESVIINVRPNGTAETRLGLTVSKAACGNAVARNRIRRRLRHAGWQICAAFQGLDVVLIGRPQTADVPWDKLLNDLRWCLKRTGHEPAC